MSLTKGAFALVDILKKEGVEYVFGIPGATEILFMDALEKEPDISYFLGLNEIVSMGMAEGYSRASGKPAFLNLHTGPGVAAALPMLYNAHAGKVPMVITAGQQDTRLLQYEPHLSGDIVGMGKLYCKHSTEITHPEDIPSIIQRALKTAMQHPQGPVLVSLPQNVLANEFSYEYRPNTPVYTGIRPDMAALSKALEIIKEAKNPVIFVESGIARCGALNEVIRFAQLTG
jgi:benzoylformate decarboxylase